MTKTLLVFLLLLLTFNACVNKNIITSTEQQIIPITTIPIRTTPIHETVQIPRAIPTPIQTPTRSIVLAPSSAGDFHQLKTVQGPILSVQERSNGFVFPQYQNKIVLLQIFGQDCPYCLEEMPIINSVKRKYASNLQIIAIQAQDAMSQETASRVIQRYQMNYPVVDKNEATNLLHFMQTTYGWTGILPYMLIIKNGVTEYSFAGAVSHQELDEAIQSLI